MGLAEGEADGEALGLADGPTDGDFSSLAEADGLGEGLGVGLRVLPAFDCFDQRRQDIVFGCLSHSWGIKWWAIFSWTLR